MTRARSSHTSSKPMRRCSPSRCPRGSSRRLRTRRRQRTSPQGNWRNRMKHLLRRTPKTSLNCRRCTRLTQRSRSSPQRTLRMRWPQNSQRTICASKKCSRWIHLYRAVTYLVANSSQGSSLYSYFSLCHTILTRSLRNLASPVGTSSPHCTWSKWSSPYPQCTGRPRSSRTSPNPNSPRTTPWSKRCIGVHTYLGHNQRS